MKASVERGCKQGDSTRRSKLKKSCWNFEWAHAEGDLLSDPSEIFWLVSSVLLLRLTRKRSQWACSDSSYEWSPRCNSLPFYQLLPKIHQIQQRGAHHLFLTATALDSLQEGASLLLQKMVVKERLSCLFDGGWWTCCSSWRTMSKIEMQQKSNGA